MDDADVDEQPSHHDRLDDQQDQKLGYLLDWLEAKVEDGQKLTESETEELQALKEYFGKT